MNYDGIIEFMNQYPLYVDLIVTTSLVIGVLIPLCLVFFDAVHASVFERRRTARCYGFHHRTMVGVCRNHSCAYSSQCVFHAPRRTFRVWLSDLFKKKKP